MKEDTFLKAKEIHDKLQIARASYNEIDGLLSFEEKKRIELRVSVNCMSVDDTRKTSIYLTDEFDEIIELIKNIRLKIVEDLERELYSLEEK